MKKPTNRPPAYFSKKAKGIWRAITTEYELEAESFEMLRVALENLDLADKARELLRIEGLVVAGKKHPASDAVKLHDGLFLRAVRQLGLDIISPGSGQAVGRRT